MEFIVQKKKTTSHGSVIGEGKRKCCDEPLGGVDDERQRGVDYSGLCMIYSLLTSRPGPA